MQARTLRAPRGASFGPYRVHERLGVGGMAEVHRATFGDTHVAIKRLRTEGPRDRGLDEVLKREARLLALFDHANIVRPLEFGELDGQCYLAMELVDGADLRRLLGACRHRCRPMHATVAARIVREVALGLDHAHDRSGPHGRPLELVHRDVSPTNILVSRAGAVKLADFGVARTGPPRPGDFLVEGKPPYLAPEQAQGRSFDRRADLFALGAIFHECLTNRSLFAAESRAATLERICHADPPRPSALEPDIAPELDAIVLKMLERDPARRYGRGHDIAAALAPFVDGGAARLGKLVGAIEPDDVGDADEDTTMRKTPCLRRRPSA
jgi:serine/threonine protein kinase